MSPCLSTGKKKRNHSICIRGNPDFLWKHANQHRSAHHTNDIEHFFAILLFARFSLSDLVPYVRAFPPHMYAPSLLIGMLQLDTCIQTRGGGGGSQAVGFIFFRAVFFCISFSARVNPLFIVGVQCQLLHLVFCHRCTSFSDLSAILMSQILCINRASASVSSFATRCHLQSIYALQWSAIQRPSHVLCHFKKICATFAGRLRVLELSCLSRFDARQTISTFCHLFFRSTMNEVI